MPKSSSKKRKRKKIVGTDLDYSLGPTTLTFLSDKMFPSTTESRLARVEETLRNLEETTGGFWRMENGTLMQVRQMSDSHLHNAHRNTALTSEVRKKMEAEMKRRETDRTWARRTESCPHGVELRLHKLETEPHASVKQRLDVLERWAGNPCRAKFDNCENEPQRPYVKPSNWREELEDIKQMCDKRIAIRHRLTLLRKQVAGGNALTLVDQIENLVRDL